MATSSHQHIFANSVSPIKMAIVGLPPNQWGIKYQFVPMPLGMVGMTLPGRMFQLVQIFANGMVDPRLMPTFGVPPTRGQQTARPGHANTSAMSRHGQGSSTRPRAYVTSSHSRQTALPSYDTAMTTDTRGQGRSRSTRAPGSSSREQGHRSKSGAADIREYEQADDDCKEFGLRDECSQWKSSSGLQTVSKVQTSMPLATKRQMKESGICIMGFDWVRQIYDGWGCEGGNHFVFDNQAAADRFIGSGCRRL